MPLPVPGSRVRGANPEPESPPGWHTVVRLVLRSATDGQVSVLHAIHVAGAAGIRVAGEEGLGRTKMKTDNASVGGATVGMGAAVALPRDVRDVLRQDSQAVERMLSEAAAVDREHAGRIGSGSASHGGASHGSAADGHSKPVPVPVPKPGVGPGMSLSEAAGIAEATSARTLPVSRSKGPGQGMRGVFSSSASLLPKVLGSLLFGNAKTFLVCSVPARPSSYSEGARLLGLASKACSVATACVRRRGIPLASMGLMDGDWGRIDEEEGLQHRDVLMAAGDADAVRAWRAIRGRGPDTIPGPFQGRHTLSLPDAVEDRVDGAGERSMHASGAGPILGGAAREVEEQELGEARARFSPGLVEGKGSHGIAAHTHNGGAEAAVRASSATRARLAARASRMDFAAAAATASKEKAAPRDDGRYAPSAHEHEHDDECAPAPLVEANDVDANKAGTGGFHGLRWLSTDDDVRKMAFGGWDSEHTAELDTLVADLARSLSADAVNAKGSDLNAQKVLGSETVIPAVQSAAPTSETPDRARARVFAPLLGDDEDAAIELVGEARM